MAELKKHLLSLHNYDEMKLEYFLLDLLTTENKPRKRKKNFTEEDVENLNGAVSVFIEKMGRT
jgi:hypothetical protein